MAGDDIDHAEEGVGAVRGGIRAALHLDAVDVLEHHAEQAALRVAQIVGRVHRTSVDIHLHACAIDVECGVIRGLRGADPPRQQEAGHQAQQLGHAARAGAADGLGVEQGHCAGHLVQRLRQAAHREHHGQVVQVVVLGHFLRTGVQRQDGKSRR